MKKIVMLGDSITDMQRYRDEDFYAYSYGSGYPIFVEGELSTKYQGQYEVYNRGISGDRVVDIYARIKKDCWNINPDYISILVGVNDIWHELAEGNGVSVDRYQKVYDMLISDTKKILPDVKIMLLEPFVLKGNVTNENWQGFSKVKDYAKVVKELAEKHGCVFCPIQKILDEFEMKWGENTLLADGVHPKVSGAKIIADEWMKAFVKLVDM